MNFNLHAAKKYHEYLLSETTKVHNRGAKKESCEELSKSTSTKGMYDNMLIDLLLTIHYSFMVV